MLRNLFFSFLVLSSTVDHIHAQSCWRDVPCSNITEPAFTGVWDANIYSPTSRIVYPKTILYTKTLQGICSYPCAPNLADNGSSIVYDFGQEVGGIVTIQYVATGSGPGAIGLAFSETRNCIGENGDASNGGFSGQDGPLLY